MATPAYSTQTSIESRISAARLVTIAGFGTGTVNAAALQSAIDFAGSYIAGKLRQTYGKDEIDSWVLPDDVPALVQNISDSLCIFQLFVTRPDLYPEGVESIKTEMDGMLDMIIESPGMLYEVDYSIPLIDVEAPDSVFDEDDNTSDSYPVERTWL